MTDPADQAVDDAVALAISVMNDDREALERVWRYHEDLMEVVVPMLMIARVLAEAFAHVVDPTGSAESVLQEFIKVLAMQEPKGGSSAQEGARDGAALALAWFRGDENLFKGLIEPYRKAKTEHVLLGGVGNVVIQIVRVIDSDPAEQEKVIRSCGKLVRSQIRGALEDDGP